MTEIAAIPERLAALGEMKLDRGAHDTFEQGHCAIELASWLAGEEFTDRPACVGMSLTNYVVTLNDAWPDEERQGLKPFLPRLLGTADDGKSEHRVQLVEDYLTGELIPAWLEAAGDRWTADEMRVRKHDLVLAGMRDWLFDLRYRQTDGGRRALNGRGADLAELSGATASYMVVRHNLGAGEALLLIETCASVADQKDSARAEEIALGMQAGALDLLERMLAL